MAPIFTPSICHIDLGAIAHNFRQLGPANRLMPVIKSDAYGHGVLETAQTLQQAGARRFAVGLASEGAALREAGHGQQIVLLMGCIGENDWQLARRYELMPLVGSFAALQKAAATDSPFSVAIKVDTGMRRLGFSLEDAPLVRDYLVSHPHLRPGMLISHLACADMPEEESFGAEQKRNFDAFYAVLKDAFPDMLRSLDNSASLLTAPKFDISRPGLAIYGGNPLSQPLDADLRWAMSVSTPIIHIRDLRAGESVSYGRIYTAEKPMRIGIAACGYATGFGRSLSNCAQVLVNGKRVPQVGRVCMSMSMVDLTNVPDAKVGDLAWLLGGEAQAGESPVSATEMADWLDTIPYEVLCIMGGQNPRKYV